MGENTSPQPHFYFVGRSASGRNVLSSDDTLKRGPVTVERMVRPLAQTMCYTCLILGVVCYTCPTLEVVCVLHMSYIVGSVLHMSYLGVVCYTCLTLG